MLMRNLLGANIRRQFSTSSIILNVNAENAASTSVNKLPKKETTIKNILYCNFGKNNVHLALVSVVEDLNFLANNSQLSYNEKMLYYLQLPQKLRISLSTGNLGFKKAARGEYEAAYQTSCKMFSLIQERQYLDDLELDFRNFGKGRQAFIDALLGKEGINIRQLVTKVSDSTKLKFGGVRSPAPRRI